MTEQRPDVLQIWAGLGASLKASRTQPLADWNAAKRMIEAVRPKMEAEADRLRSLLKQSRAKLEPLGEPLELDLGLHRWLNAEREEAYSDWLEWVVRQAETPHRVFRLFGLKAPDKLASDARLDVKREVCVPHGHVDREGRLDLVVYFGGQAAIIVEVKKGDADHADTAKHVGYKESLHIQGHADAKRVLLSVSAEEEDYGGFVPCTWASLCIETRWLAIELGKSKRMMSAAMVLAFAAAVEQNLLGFSAQLIQRIQERTCVFFNVSVVDHIEQFLKCGGPE